MQQTPSPCTAGETLGPKQVVEKTISRNGENRSAGGEAAAEWAQKKGEDEGDDEKTTFFFAWAQETPAKFARPFLAAVGEDCKSLDF